MNYYDGKNVRIYGGSSSVLTAVFNSDGNVGIGTTSPTQKLDVNGKMSVGPNSTWGRNLLWVLILLMIM